MKSGFISIIGRPNVGKSTLLNAILGEKIAITTDKPQTTRNTVRGIYNNKDIQMIFMDTPGIHKPRNKLGTYMRDCAVNTFKEVDLILFIVDEDKGKGPGDSYIVEMLREVKTPKLLLINKVDILGPKKYESIYREYEELKVFDGIYGISAIENRNVDMVLNAIEEFIPEGPMFFPKEMITDHPERFIVSEIIREKLLMYLEDEIPHGVAVEIESFKEKNTITEIGAVIYCEKKSHKSIIIGKKGRKLKGIGSAARKEIEGILGAKVFLELWVKVKENWRDNSNILSGLGYREN